MSATDRKTAADATGAGTRLRILIADSLAPEGARFLEAQPGVDVHVKTGLAGDDLARLLASHDGVVVRSAVQVDAHVLDGAALRPESRLRAIARAGVGVDNIDLSAATRRGVAVLNSASASTITTAEHAFALLIALARNIGAASRTMHEGGWDRKQFVGTQLHGKTLGVVGFGRIGRTLARRAIAFGMKVMAYDPLTSAESTLDGQVRLAPDFDALVPEVDALSFHVPLNDDTRGMLGAAQFERARPGLLVVNAARGGVIDETALVAALDAGRCAGAAIDVWTTEPPPADHPLRTHPKVLCTPHLGASTVEAQEAVAVAACDALVRYLRGEPVFGAVNTGGLALDLTDRQRAFADLAGRMVALLEALREDRGARRMRVTVRGASIAGRADTIGRFALAAFLRRHLDEPVNVINAALVAEQRGLETEVVIAAETGDDRITLELTGDSATHRVDGAIFADSRPRITNLDGAAVDMVPAGPMVVLSNEDTPGRIGLVGRLFGEANLNIAEMVIHRRAEHETPTDAGDADEPVAMMILKLDEPPPPTLVSALRDAPGIRRVSVVPLPPVAAPT